MHKTVYRWIDASGTIHIESRPPPAGTQAELLTFGDEKTAEVDTDHHNPARDAGTGTSTNNPMRGPLNVYSQDGFSELLDRLDRTVNQLGERQRLFDKVSKDL